MLKALYPAKAEAAARWACAALLLACAAYVYLTRYLGYRLAIEHWPPFDGFFWDAKVYSAAGALVAQGQDPFAAPVITTPLTLPFISAPLVAWSLGWLYRILGPGLDAVLKLAHIAALILTPLIASRLFLGKGVSAAAYGYALFLAGLGAWGVGAVLTGNFGCVLYLALFAAIAHGLATRKWFWLHVAIVVAVQVKPPYALFWIVPVLVNGWSWREVRNSAIAFAVALGLYGVSYLIDPAFYGKWMDALHRQVVGVPGGQPDLGFSAYAGARRELGDAAGALAPYAIHALIALALLFFVLRDRSKGVMKAAALIAVAIVINPRLKEYDIAFAAIPVAGLMLSALATPNARPERRALAVILVTALMLVMLKADQLPLIGPFILTLGVAAGVAALAKPGGISAPAAA